PAALGAACWLALLVWLGPRGLLGLRAWKVWLLMAALAVLLRLALDLGRGYEGDVALYLARTWKVVTLGLHTAYLNISEVPPSDNPPFQLYPFWLLGWLFQQLFSPLFRPP